MIFNMKYKFLALVAIVAALVACDSGNKFTVDGTVDGGGDTTRLVLEYSTDGMWVMVDSTTTDGGKFEITGDAPQFPNIYRLRHGDRSIYLPIDSVDHITVKTSLKDFDSNYTLSGSEHAKQVMEIDKKAREFASAKDVDSTALNKWKHDLAVNLLKDPSGIVAYYVINKQINERPLFDPLNNQDLKVIGAVANAFNTYRKNDPRTQYLVNVLLDGQRRRRIENNQFDTIQATQAKLININLQDVHGKMQSLDEVSSHGNVVILNYTMMTAQFSPALNKILNDIYNKYKDRGVVIYQIALDDSEADWLLQARRMPWICVRDPEGATSPNVTAYNVTGVPTCFIIGRNGEIVERVEDATLLEQAIAKHM